MKTIALYLPKWLRVRLQKAASPKPRPLSLKDRQILPRLASQVPPAIYSRENRSVGDRVLARL